MADDEVPATPEEREAKLELFIARAKEEISRDAEEMIGRIEETMSRLWKHYCKQCSQTTVVKFPMKDDFSQEDFENGRIEFQDRLRWSTVHSPDDYHNYIKPMKDRVQLIQRVARNHAREVEEYFRYKHEHFEWLLRTGYDEGWDLDNYPTKMAKPEKLAYVLKNYPHLYDD